MATIWRGGCLIRARFLDRIKDAYAERPDLPSLLLAPYFRDAVAHAQDAWRRVVCAAVELGAPTPAFSTTLAYYDGYRRERTLANLIQACATTSAPTRTGGWTARGRSVRLMVSTTSRSAAWTRS